MQFSPLKKILIATVLIASLVLPSAGIFFLAPRHAEAQFTGGLPGLLVPTGDIPDQIKQTILDTLVFSIASVMLEQITTSIVNWINSGFDDNPAFVEDLGGFLTDVADQAVVDFVRAENPDFANLICSPFQIDIEVALKQHNRPITQSQCTLTDVIDNVESFIEGNFSDGGWEGWFHLTSKPSNNPYGAYVLAQDELSRRVANAVDIEEKKLDFGRGFRSFEICQDGSKPSKLDEDGGGFWGNACDDGSRPVVGTPGAVIENQLEGALQIGQNRLTIADEIDEIVGALLSQLLTQVITGSGGLSGYSDDDIDTGGGSGGGGGGNGGGGGTPPPPGNPGPPINFEQSGVFLAAEEGNSRIQFNLPVAVDDTYTSATIDFDVFVDSFGGPVFTGALADFRSPGENRYFAAFVNVRNEDTRGKRTVIDFINKTSTEQRHGWQENTNYHVQITYDTLIQRMAVSITNTDTGEALAPFSTSIPSNVGDIRDFGSGLVIGFGLVRPADGGAYYPPYGWRFSNLSVSLESAGGFNIPDRF